MYSNKKEGNGPSFLIHYAVLSVGIEPTLQAPQACVLSIERREHEITNSYSVSENCLLFNGVVGLPWF